LDLPQDAWIGIEMRATVGQPGARWSLTVTLPAGKIQEFKDLACDPDWTEARWVGFSSNSDGPISYYLDDLEMENR